MDRNEKITIIAGFVVGATLPTVAFFRGRKEKLARQRDRKILTDLLAPFNINPYN